ncbi:flocculation protein FLO11 [Gadus morhua]|uniref:Serine/threonine-protein kinase haspin n=1 Tax=Gadus morhua TaxID=8049 RepID=A0A8C4ZXA2_GADMO|nr:serine/threonine-protein kinase haspin [Gadus morhua]
MDRGRPLFMKTYSKHLRQIPAWISPDSHKLAFDSSLSTGADSSVLEPPIAPEISMESATFASRKGRRPAKRKVPVCQKEKENTSPAVDPPVKQRKKYSRWTTAKPSLDSSESEVDFTSRPKRSKVTAQRKKKLINVPVPSAGRYVTLRRAAPPRAVRGKASCSFLNSSAEFVANQESVAPRRILRPATALQSCTSDVSEPGSVTLSLVADPHRPEVSPADAAERVLGPSPSKPLFCSTPSVSRRRSPAAATVAAAAPPQDTLSHLSFLCTSQEDPHSPGDPFHAPNAKSQDEETGCPYVMDGIPFPAASSHISSDTDNDSCFVSAPAWPEWPEWMLEVLKHICLTEHCTVALERLEKLIPGYLDGSSSGHFQKTPRSTESVDDSHSVDPARSEGNGATPDPTPTLHAGDVTERQPAVSAHGDRTAGFSQSASSSADRQSAQFTDGFVSVDNTTCSEDSEDLSCVCIDPTYNVDDDEDDEEEEVDVDRDNDEDSDCSVAGARGTHPLEDSPPVEERGAALRPKECHVPLRRVSLSPQPATTPLQLEASSPRSHTVEQTESSSAPQTDQAGRKRDRTSTASRCRAVPCPTPPPPDRGGGAAGPPEPATTPQEACLTKPCAVLVKRTPDPGPAPRSGPAPDGPEPDEAKRPARSPRRRSSSKGVPEVAVAPHARAAEPLSKPAQRKAASKAPKVKRKRCLSKDQGSGTARKACVSGLSVSRWKDQSNTSSTLLFQAPRGAPKAGECSFTEPLSLQHKPSTVWSPGPLRGSSGLLSSPVRALGLNLSSVLAHFTPNTHTWSRLKASLSVHRKKRVVVNLEDSFSRDISTELFATSTQTPSREYSRASLLLSPPQSASQNGEDLSDAQKVYSECGQQGPLSWEESILPHRLARCLKVGEGTFGEVFSTTNASGQTVAIKIIPVEGSKTVNGEPQKTFGEILAEIIISKELSDLRNKTHNQTNGFIGLQDLHCVQGCYPPVMLQAWDAFDQCKGSENDRPDFFEPQQLFLILEFEFGGSDLENCNGTLSSLSVAKSILHQVTAALAVAEQELCFEHRDLHWGNVLVETTKAKKGAATFLLDGTNHSLDTKGVLVHIIDFSLSRLEIDGLTVSCDISNEEELFTGQGDYQFDIYRLMRQANGNNWNAYRPHSNVMWLHYLSGKLQSMKYRGNGGRGNIQMRKMLTHFHDNVLQYTSATDALRSCPLFH